MTSLFVGTPKKLLRVTPGMLPTSKNLQFMYAYRADLSDLDLSGFNLRDSDWIECKAENIDFTGADVAGMYCKGTAFPGAKLPPDVWYCTNGLIEEIMRQQRFLVPEEHRKWYDHIITGIEHRDACRLSRGKDAAQNTPQ